MKTDMEPGYGWTAGLLLKRKRFSFGVSYRSAIATDYVGVGRLTQVATGDPQYDELARATLPFGQDLPLSSSLEYPDQASVGFAWNLSKSLLVEMDVNRTGWGSVQDLELRFPVSSWLDTAYRLDFEDAMTYRLGASWRLRTGPKLRVGYAFDETPQPETAVGAFLPDSNRNIVSVGAGLDWLDVAFSWITYDQRIVYTSAERLNGNYRPTAGCSRCRRRSRGPRYSAAPPWQRPRAMKDLDSEARNVYSPFMSARAAHPAGNPAYLLVESLDDPRLRLSSALYVEPHWEPEGVTLHHPESDVFGYGETEADALDDFRKAFVELFLTLSSDRVALGPALQRTLQVLDEVVQLA